MPSSYPSGPGEHPGLPTTRMRCRRPSNAALPALLRKAPWIWSILWGCTASPTGPDNDLPGLQSDRLAATAQQSCLVQRSGEVFCWGLGDAKGVTPGDGSLRFVALRGGWDHLCGLTADSTAYCWGRNDWGQLGDGTRVERSQPTRVATDLELVAITASVHTTCALEATGAAHCWGRNGFGAVGNGVAGESEVELRPTEVAGTARFRTLDGAWANCAIALEGRAFCWGSIPGRFEPTGYVAPGDCSTAYYEWYEGRQCIVPTPIAGELRFESLAGDRCGVTDGGEAYCWGDGQYGTLGDGRVGVHSVSPVRVEGGIRFQALTAGASHVCGLDLYGTAYCWGNNFVGQLGIGDNGASGGTLVRAVPTPVVTDERFVTIVAGAAHTCALAADETVWCWGDNESNQLGEAAVGELSDVPVPVVLKGF